MQQPRSVLAQIGLVMFAVLLSIMGVMALSTSAHAATTTTYYVGLNGSDTNPGTSLAAPFRTLDHAASLTNPGDTVYVLGGTYADTDILSITRSGAPGAYITYAAYPGQHPILHTATRWNHILVDGASYIIIQGFTVQGNDANLTLADALAHQDPLSPTYNTNGISVQRNAGTVPHSSHIIIRNNVVFDCPGGGISAIDADYVTVEGNVTHSNSWYTNYGSSGISLLTSYNSDTSTGTKNVVAGNISYDNETKVPWVSIGKISDGNGIIIDSNKITADNSVPYTGRTLVANNLVYDNGGSGIHSYNSQHVDIINNTAYDNSRSPALNYASIYAASSTDVNILNNISYVRSGKITNVTYGNTAVNYDYNVYFNGTAPATQGPHDVIADPQFVNANDGLSTTDFHLRAGSPAIGSGTSAIAQPGDIVGNPRPSGAGVDRGAYQTVIAAPAHATPTPSLTATAQPTPPGTLTTTPVSVGAPPFKSGTPPGKSTALDGFLNTLPLIAVLIVLAMLGIVLFLLFRRRRTEVTDEPGKDGDFTDEWESLSSPYMPLMGEDD